MFRGPVKRNRTKGFLVRYVQYNTVRESPSSLDYESFGKVLYDGDRANDSRRNERPIVIPSGRMVESEGLGQGIL